MADATMKLRAETSSFRTQIKQATATVKALDAELKLNEAQYKASGDSEEYLKNKAKLLIEQISEQSKVVENARAAMQKFEQAGATSSAAYVSLRTTVATASTALQGMRTQLADTVSSAGGIDRLGSMLDGAATSAQNLGTKLGNVDAAKLNNAANEASGLKTAVDSAGTAADTTKTDIDELDKEKLDNVQKEAGQLNTEITEAGTQAGGARIALDKLDQETLDKVQGEAKDLTTEESNAKTGAEQVTEALGGLNTASTGEEAVKDLGALDDKEAETGENTDNLQTNLEDIGKEISIEGISQSLDKISGALQNVISKAAQYAKAMWSFQVDAGAYADDIATRATEYSIDPETLMRMEAASQLVDTSVEAIAKARNKLTQIREVDSNWLTIFSDEELAAMQAEAADIQAGLFDLTNKNVDGTLTTSEQLFQESITKLGLIAEKYGDGAAEKVAQAWYGRSWMEMKPLVSAGWDAYEEQMQQANVLSNEQITILCQQDDAYQNLLTTWNTTKNALAAELAPAFTQVANALNSLLEKFLEWSKTEEGQKALDGLAAAISSLFTSLTENTNMDSIVAGITGAIGKLTNALNWFNENIGLKTVIEGILGVFAAIKVASGVTSIIQLCNSISMLAKLSTSKITANVAAAAGGTGTAGTAGAAAGGSGIGTVLGSTAAKVAGSVAFGLYLMSTFETANDEYQTLLGNAIYDLESQMSYAANYNKYMGFKVTRGKDLKYNSDAGYFKNSDGNDFHLMTDEAEQVFRQVIELGNMISEDYTAWMTNGNGEYMEVELTSGGQIVMGEVLTELEYLAKIGEQTNAEIKETKEAEQQPDVKNYEPVTGRPKGTINAPETDASQWTPQLKQAAVAFWDIFSKESTTGGNKYGDLWGPFYDYLESSLSKDEFARWDEYTNKLFMSGGDFDMSEYLGQAGQDMGESLTDGIELSASNVESAGYALGCVFARSVQMGASLPTGTTGVSRTWANNYGNVTIVAGESSAEAFRDWQMQRIAAIGG